MSAFWDRLRSRGSKGAITLIFGTAFGQLITLAITPILARMYSDTDFGYLSLVLSSASIAAPAAALRLESALMLPRSSRDATALLSAGLCSAVVISAFSAGLLTLLFSFGLLENMSRLPWIALWVAAIVFLTAAFTLLSQFALRGHRYGPVARRSIYQSGLAAGAQLGLGLAGASATGLIGGYAIGRVAGIAPLTLALRSELERFGRGDMRRVVREYWRFPVLFAPSAVLNSAGLVLPILFVGTWFTVADAGQWGMADRLLAAPLVLVATSIGQVAEAHMSETYRESRPGLARYYLSVSGVLAGMSAAMVAIIVFLGPWIVPIFLGDGWEKAVHIMIALLPMLATRLIASPMSKVLIVLQHGAWNLVLDVMRVVMVVTAVIVAISLDLDVVEAAWCTSITLSAVYVVTWIVGLQLARRYTPASPQPIPA
ncbi:oligosaccharide flippase family protein [Microbacterium sp. LTA6]|uniref:oligosaccharide flippase family protein n=1 Tax=Microbacterium sp. LTA6 TaxID=3129771 RepID=UPI003254483C